MSTKQPLVTRCGPVTRRGLRHAVAGALVFMAAAGSAIAPTAARASSCSTDSTPASMKPAEGTRPVIFVHGWTADGHALRETGKALARRTDNRITPYYFDYSKDATTWAGSNAVSGCLAKYITAVSTTYGADGKVLLVAHSMGGLAILYAAAKDGAGSQIGGVVTFDTPYLGSPFGNTSLGGFFQGRNQGDGVNLPPEGSDAQVCMGAHENGARLPSACAYDLPPYLATAVPVTQIAGVITIKRMLGPFHLYDIPLGSDGIVPESSSHGYVTMRKSSQRPHGEKLSLPTDACTITSDTLSHAATVARWTDSQLAALAEGAGELAADNNAFDGLLSGTLTPALVAYLGAATLAAPCSHIHIYSYDRARDQATDALKAYLDELTPPTRVVKLAPVDKRGRPVSGWSVDTQSADSDPVDCGDGVAYPSPTALTGNIYYCSPTAASADTCWPSRQRLRMLCLIDPWSHTLTEQGVQVPVVPVAADRNVYPIGLELADNDHCRLRNGGAWDVPKTHPNYFGAYFCEKNQAVWAPRSLPGAINKSGKQWTVTVGRSDGQLKTAAVLTAYYVTTAP
jgi:pimeloyl-ACP methyl ester carboxylesterase